MEKEQLLNDINYAKKINLLIKEIRSNLNKFQVVESRLLGKSLLSTFEIYMKCLTDLEKEVE